MVVIRRRIAKDNNCLFSACGYLCEGRQGSICTELRAAVAEHVRGSSEISEVMLGMPVDQYCKWIKNEMNWGGENEICFLCDKFNVEIQVVMMGVSSSSLTYGQGEERRGRIYLLYTGQHYDALVGGDNSEVMPDAETKVFTLGTACDVFDAQVVPVANEYFVEDAKKAAMCVKKMLKCGGCGALLDDTAAFQEHCGEVEHDDDFGYECSEVEIEVDGAADTDDWHSFYKTPAEALSTLFPAPFKTHNTEFATVEHFFYWSRYKSYNDSLAATLLETQDPMQVEALGEFGEGGRGDWDQVKEGVLLEGNRCKFAQNEAVKMALLATNDKPLRAVGAGTWAGVVVEGASTRGANKLGEMLTLLRAQLREPAF
eukprot:CAMPEP_0179475266 /NCGR_PEP_ID=MMETSP0799-20121207/54514_1 /TAXON_ID=46947 /ORGANISM="Geminigera cryophila, Strain CCMP2564" /LENGTH=370 /DNA_ID=CAMNT_0021284741 /DNA_START=12 /DNA_END=1124 /DNA_ORIENTATION=-